MVIRHLDDAQRWDSLTPHDHAILDRVLHNELDMAYRRRARILLDYLELQDSQCILDGGCGMGFYLMAMGRLRQLQLVGLDYDPVRIDWAERARTGSLLRGDLHRLPFADATFDRILLSEVLEHVPDDQQALREALRVLRPDGILAISVPHARYPFLWDPINRIWTGLGGSPLRSGPLVGIWSLHQRLYEPEQLAERVEAAGFRIERIEETTHYSLPLTHFLLYGVGKPLLEHNLLPGALQRSADRLGGEQNSETAFNPIDLARMVFRAVDRLNDQPIVVERDTFVNVLLKARKLPANRTAEQSGR
jgi:SAM-dependent methyltransferase